MEMRFPVISQHFSIPVLFPLPMLKALCKRHYAVFAADDVLAELNVVLAG